MPRSGRLLAFVAAGLLVVAPIAGCGDGGGDEGGDDGATSGGGSSATSAKGASSGVGFTCPDVAEVNAAVGHDLAVDGEQSNKYCKYAVEDDASGNSITVIYTWSSFDVTEDPGVADPETVPGVGQRAVWDDGGNVLTVWTGKGSVLVNFLPIGYPDVDQKTTAVALAELVL